MKKFIILLLISITLISFIYAENIEDKGVNGVAINFCNDGLEHLQRTLIEHILPLEEKKICLSIKNNNNVDKRIRLGFVLGATNNKGRRSCLAIGSKGINFATEGSVQYVNILANNNFIYETTIKFPLGLSGKIDTCLLYQEAEEKKENNGGIVIDAWRKLYMDFYIGNTENISNKINISNTKQYLNSKNEAIVEITVKNLGDLSNKVVLEGEISNMFGFINNTIATGEIENNGQYVFTVNFGQIPLYKGLYKFNFKLKYKPYFNFDIKSFGFSGEMLDEKSITIEKSLFIMPRLYLGIAILIIFLLIIAFRKPKQKIVYIQQPTPNK